MSLPLARIGAVASHPATRAAAGFLGGSALVGAGALAARYAYDSQFRDGASIPNPISWKYGLPAVAGLAATITGVTLGRPSAYRQAWSGGMLLAGAGLGVAGGLFLAEPLAHRLVIGSR